jgi:Tfp pilus assembly protein PilN
MYRVRAPGGNRMTRINLLPPEIREKAERPHLAPWFLLMGLVTILVIVGLYFLYSGQKSSKDETLKQKNQELADLQKQTKGLKEFEDQQSKLQSLEQIYQRANSGRVPWAQMLNDLAMYVPEGLATASNPRAPSIWLTTVTIDAQSLENIAGAAPAGQAAAGAASTPIAIEGYAAPSWLCIQTWLPRASDFKAKGFLDAYPYYYYFRGHPKVAEFFVRLQNMEEWSNLWITESVQETIGETRQVPDPANPGQTTEETYSDWAIRFTIKGQWNPEKAIWQGTGQQSGTSGGS